MTKHSDKALETLRQMNTTPDQWQLTEIEWVEEEREIDGLVTCPDCQGRKFVRLDDAGAVIARPARAAYGEEGYYAAEEAQRAYDAAARKQSSAANRHMGMYGNCRRCTRKSRGWFVPQGTVKGRVVAKVMVGYPKFPAGTKFDARYFGGLHCNLCNKLILKSGRVPVHGTGADGVTHGMMVGEDCARKFLDVKIKRAADSIMEDAK